jgi:hypothetical protein
MQAIRRLEESKLPLLLTQGEAARQLSVSLTELKSLVRLGLVPVVRLKNGGHPKIRAEDLVRLIADRVELRILAKRPARKRKPRKVPYSAKLEAAKTRERLRRRKS